MSIIFDEYQYALGLLKNGFSGYMKWKDLFILAKYYRYMGESNHKIRNNLLKFCLKFVPNYNDVIFGERLNQIIKKSEKQNLRLPNNVLISRTELETIRNVKNYKLEKLLFVMLVISKNSKMNSGSINQKYYINQNFSSLFPLARIYMNKEEKNYTKHYLYKLGLIAYPEPNYFIVNNKKENYIILYADNNMEEGVLVTNLNNIISFYKPLCSNCGKVVDRISKRHQLCSNCYLEKRRETYRMSKRKARESIK